MANNSPDLVGVTVLLERARRGDPTARGDLIRACQTRLEQLARRMLRGFPSVRRWADTGDVFQNSALRLLRAVEQTDVADTRQFLNLAAAVIRRELIDLARHFQRPHGVGANHASHGPEAPRASDPPAPANESDEIDRWCALHEAVERLPAEEREVVVLTFYHRWTRAQIAQLFHVDERTIRRRWRAAAARLSVLLGGDLPRG
jgi:RNA polymerase sigma factor (sigma-70 family)